MNVVIAVELTARVYDSGAKMDRALGPVYLEGQGTQ